MDGLRPSAPTLWEGPPGRDSVGGARRRTGKPPRPDSVGGASRPRFYGRHHHIHVMPEFRRNIRHLHFPYFFTRHSDVSPQRDTPEESHPSRHCEEVSISIYT